MKLYYNGEEIGDITTNRSLTIKEALYSLGYDLDDPDDLEQAYEDKFPAAYLDDEGNYQIDEENIMMVYDVFNADSFGSNCPKNWDCRLRHPAGCPAWRTWKACGR